MSYTLDIYFGKLRPTDSFLKFMLYVAFFPQLVAGPIVRAVDFIPQLTKKIVFSYNNLKLGLTLIGFGIVKKVVFADNISPLVDGIFSDPLSRGSVLIMLGALAFGIQIYCDFSGYTDIARGAARMLGFYIPLNFDKPYFARSFSDFWRKWHISLSSWLRDYLYIPLGGNRKGVKRTHVNLMATMLLGGLWHGAAWNFVVWGGYQGVLLSLNKVFSRLFRKGLISLIVTQYFVFLGWLIFRVKDPSHILYSVKKYLLFDFSLQGLELISLHKLSIVMIFVFCYFHLVSYILKNPVDRVRFLKLRYWVIFIVVVVLLLLIFAPSQTSEFIYFQF